MEKSAGRVFYGNDSWDHYIFVQQYPAGACSVEVGLGLSVHSHAPKYSGGSGCEVRAGTSISTRRS